MSDLLFHSQYDVSTDSWIHKYNTDLSVLPRSVRYGRRAAFLEKSNNFYRLVPSGVFVKSSSGGVSRSRRGFVRSFSVHSKNRLFACLDDYDVKWKSFITLTYRFVNDWQFDSVPSPSVPFSRDEFGNKKLDLKKSYAHLKAFIRKVNSLSKEPFLFVWKKEFTRNGMIHYHLVTNADFTKKKYRDLLRCYWAGITNNDSMWGGFDVQKVKKQGSICWYLSKYLAKNETNSKGYQLKAPLVSLLNCFVGRWWGVFNGDYYKKSLPVRVELGESVFNFLYRKMLHLKKISLNKKGCKRYKFTPSLRFHRFDKVAFDALDAFTDKDFVQVEIEYERITTIQSAFPSTIYSCSLEELLS